LLLLSLAIAVQMLHYNQAVTELGSQERRRRRALRLGAAAATALRARMDAAITNGDYAAAVALCAEVR
jgi:hypothetical protein